MAEQVQPSGPERGGRAPKAAERPVLSRYAHQRGPVSRDEGRQQAEPDAAGEASAAPSTEPPGEKRDGRDGAAPASRAEARGGGSPGLPVAVRGDGVEISAPSTELPPPPGAAGEGSAGPRNPTETTSAAAPEGEPLAAAPSIDRAAEGSVDATSTASPAAEAAADYAADYAANYAANYAAKPAARPADDAAAPVPPAAAAAPPSPGPSAAPGERPAHRADAAAAAHASSEPPPPPEHAAGDAEPPPRPEATRATGTTVDDPDEPVRRVEASHFEGPEDGDAPRWAGDMLPVRQGGRAHEAAEGKKLPLWKRIALPLVQTATAASAGAAAKATPARPVNLEPILTRLNALEKQLAANQSATEGQLARFEENITRLWELEEQLTLTEVRERLALLEANQEEIADGLHAVGRNLVLVAVVLATGIAAGLLALGLLL